MVKRNAKYNDNPAMIESAIPNLKLLNEERTKLKNVILQNGHDVIEFDFPDELDRKNLSMILFSSGILLFPIKTGLLLY